MTVQSSLLLLLLLLLLLFSIPGTVLYCLSHRYREGGKFHSLTREWGPGYARKFSPLSDHYTTKTTTTTTNGVLYLFSPFYYHYTFPFFCTFLSLDWVVSSKFSVTIFLFFFFFWQKEGPRVPMIKTSKSITPRLLLLLLARCPPSLLSLSLSVRICVGCHISQSVCVCKERKKIGL